MSVLLICDEEDGPSVRVENYLWSWGVETWRLNTELFPWETCLSFHQSARISSLNFTDAAGKTFDLSCVKAVWYRSEANPRLPHHLDKQVREAAVRETRDFLACVYGWLEGVPWLDPIPNMERAEQKFLQLSVASACKFVVPPTVITNDAACVKQFASRHGGPLVAKMLSPVSITRGSNELSVFTSDQQPEDLEELDGLRFSPMVFQVKVPRRFEVRITVVGREFFAVRVDPTGDYRDQTDYRKCPNLPEICKPFALPPDEMRKVSRLMDQLDLRYGAIDLVVTPSNEFVFLEINPCGDWSWLPEQTQDEVACAIAKTLRDDVACSRSQTNATRR